MPGPVSPQKTPIAEKERANCTRGNKNPKEHHNPAAGAPKRQDGPPKEREETTNDNESDTTTGDYPDACALPIRKNKDFLHGSTVVSTMFRKTGGVPRAQKYVHAHCLQMGGLIDKVILFSPELYPLGSDTAPLGSETTPLDSGTTLFGF